MFTLRSVHKLCQSGVGLWVSLQELALKQLYKKTKQMTYKSSALHCLTMSGYQDSNLGPPAPKAGALTGLRYIPWMVFHFERQRYTIFFNLQNFLQLFSIFLKKSAFFAKIFVARRVLCRFRVHHQRQLLFISCRVSTPSLWLRQYSSLRYRHNPVQLWLGSRGRTLRQRFDSGARFHKP